MRKSIECFLSSAREKEATAKPTFTFPETIPPESKVAHGATFGAECDEILKVNKTAREKEATAKPTFTFPETISPEL